MLEYGPACLTERQMVDGWIKCHQTCMDVGRVISAVNSYLKTYISSLTVQGKAMVEDAQRKFTVWKARSWRIFKAKVHNLIVNEKRKNRNMTIYPFIFAFYVGNIVFVFLVSSLKLSEHRQSFSRLYRKLWLWRLMHIGMIIK